MAMGDHSKAVYLVYYEDWTRANVHEMATHQYPGRCLRAARAIPTASPATAIAPFPASYPCRWCWSLANQKLWAEARTRIFAFVHLAADPPFFAMDPRLRHAVRAPLRDTVWGAVQTLRTNACCMGSIFVFQGAKKWRGPSLGASPPWPSLVGRCKSC